ncbi:hypothetical protein GBAR_LOCUS7024 [Geodia barretti]|uniref:LamG domain-containing protein n=1 Tax=Geodia barretti TaxID=519541 RepID=A0AA35RIF7_GEOBA|nr:hypothetical protein GBAR_LOCUS7024 [Geodia barretti]
MENTTMIQSFRRYFALSFSVLFLIGNIVVPALGQAEKKEDLIGHWTFENGVELEDLTGHFGDIDLLDADVKDGKLRIGNNEWAMTTGYKGPDIGPDKTLVTWIYLDDLSITRGATLAVNKSSGDTFDAIVYAERQPKRWMAGSSHFRRTQDADPGFEEKETGKLIQLAISYEDDGGNTKIMIYRDGDVIGDYTMGPIVSWEAGDVEALFGPRALIGGTAYGWVVARVEDARIYNAVLDEKEINNLTVDTLDVEARGKLAATWGRLKFSK